MSNLFMRVVKSCAVQIKGCLPPRKGLHVGKLSIVVIIQDYEDQKKQYHNLEKDYVVHGEHGRFLIPRGGMKMGTAILIPPMPGETVLLVIFSVPSPAPGPVPLKYGQVRRYSPQIKIGLFGDSLISSPLVRPQRIASAQFANPCVFMIQIERSIHLSTRCAS